MTETEIANLALSHLAHSKEISNLETERTPEALACKRFYGIARDTTLRDFEWPFATKFETLGMVAQNPAEIDQEWAYSYRYPTNCSKLRRIITGIKPINRQSQITYAIGRDAEGLLIYTNESEAEIEFTYTERDTSRYPPDFVLALSFRLAAYIAPRITAGDPFQLGNRALKQYEMEIQKARATANNEQQQFPDAESEFVRSRDASYNRWDEFNTSWWR
jgi:hypothetical protein